MEGINDVLQIFNPFSENFIVWQFISALGDLFATLFENVGFILEKIGSIFEWLGDFATHLLEAFIHIFVPTDSQWEDIKQNYAEIGDLIGSKIPFYSDFRNSLESAQNTSFANSDFLNIEMPSFSFYGGQTEKTQYINVRDAYEPYREFIRDGLAFIVYGCAFVYLLKTVLNYKATAEGISQANNMKGD